MSQEVTECRKCKHQARGKGGRDGDDEELPVFQDSELCGNCDRDFWTWVPLKKSPVVFPTKKTMVEAVIEFIG